MKGPKRALLRRLLRRKSAQKEHFYVVTQPATRTRNLPLRRRTPYPLGQPGNHDCAGAEAIKNGGTGAFLHSCVATVGVGGETYDEYGRAQQCMAHGYCTQPLRACHAAWLPVAVSGLRTGWMRFAAPGLRCRALVRGAERLEQEQPASPCSCCWRRAAASHPRVPSQRGGYRLRSGHKFSKVLCVESFAKQMY